MRYKKNLGEALNVNLKRLVVMELRKSMTLKAALGYMDLAKSSCLYEKRPRSEDRRVWPLDSELVKALKELKGYELTLGYDKVTDYLRVKHDRIWNRKKVYRHMKALK